MEPKKVIYKNYFGKLKNLRFLNDNTYLMDMELEDGGFLRLQIDNPEDIKWIPRLPTVHIKE